MATRPQPNARPKPVPQIAYNFTCTAAHHPEREGQDGWYDGVVATMYGPPPPAPPPTVASAYCTACSVAIDGGEVP